MAGIGKTPSRSSYDAVVIGGGHNGLVAAAYLARGGLKVLVLERRSVLGGAAATEEVFPGFRANTGSGDAGMFLPKIVADLNLVNHDLEFIESPIIALALQLDGQPLPLWRDRHKALEEIACFSEPDAAGYLQFLKVMDSYTEIVEAIRRLTPPSLPNYNLNELVPWFRAGMDLRRMGNAEMMAFMRVLPMPVTDFLDEWFETPVLKAALGMTGVAGCMQGPRAAGTTFMFLYHALGAGEAGFRASRFVRGGIGKLSEALAQAARLHGAEICTGAGVKGIHWQGKRAAGVILEDGERIFSQMVISSADPRTTFFDLVGPSNLEVRFVREVKNIKFRGSTARITLALEGLPDFSGLSQVGSLVGGADLLSGHIIICPDLDTLERAYDEAKYGRFSQNPCLDIVIPTILDPSLAPEGKHLASIDVRYAPYDLRDQTWETAAAVLADRVVEILETYAPGIKTLIRHRQILTPLDYERAFGLAEGSIFHGQMGLDQLLFMRPVPGSARYATPIENLYLCSAGTHPGGGVTGAPGYLAASEILKRSGVD